MVTADKWWALVHGAQRVRHDWATEQNKTEGSSGF